MPTSPPWVEYNPSENELENAIQLIHNTYPHTRDLINSGTVELVAEHRGDDAEYNSNLIITGVSDMLFGTKSFAYNRLDVSSNSTVLDAGLTIFGYLETISFGYERTHELDPDALIPTWIFTVDPASLTHTGTWTVVIPEAEE